MRDLGENQAHSILGLIGIQINAPPMENNIIYSQTLNNLDLNHVIYLYVDFFFFFLSRDTAVPLSPWLVESMDWNSRDTGTHGVLWMVDSKLYAHFQLHGGWVPLIPPEFKGHHICNLLSLQKNITFNQKNFLQRIFQCCSFGPSHPRLLPQSLKDCSINLCLFFFLFCI